MGFERRTVARYSRRVRPSEVDIPDDRQEHWLSFQRAQGGDVDVHSEEGRKVELDERPLSEVLEEQQRLRDLERPLEYDVRSLLDWFQEMGLPDRWTRLEPLESARGLLLAHLAEAAQLTLGATLFILQKRETAQ